MKFVYCEKCGKALQVTPKSFKELGRILKVVEAHECGEPVPIDLEPIYDPGKVIDETQFVQKSNELLRNKPEDIRSKEHIREELTSTAPEALKNFVESFSEGGD